MITVQLITPRLEEADPDHSLNMLDSPSEFYANFKVPKRDKLGSRIQSSYALRLK